jgi:hypothetical protein
MLFVEAGLSFDTDITANLLKPCKTNSMHLTTTENGLKIKPERLKILFFTYGVKFIGTIFREAVVCSVITNRRQNVSFRNTDQPTPKIYLFICALLNDAFQ